MSIAGFMWECSCGNMAYGETPPEECSKCNKIDSFIKLPEEIVKEREKDIIKEVGDFKEEKSSNGRKSKPRKTAKRTRRISR